MGVGTIVLHSKRLEWGPGKVLATQAGGIVAVYFRDLSEKKLGDAVKKISTMGARYGVTQLRQNTT